MPEYLPAEQETHVLAMLAPVEAEYDPAAQAVHAAVPIESLYFPATHASHVPPSGPVKPRLQTQLVGAVDPTADCVLLGQV